MGSSSSASLSPTSEHVHQRLGNVKLLNIPSPLNPNQTLTHMQKIIPLRQDQQFQIWQQSLNRIKNSQTTDVIFLPQKYHFQSAGMCGTTGYVTMIFQDYFFVLESEIRNRQKHNKPFLETEIWYLLYNMIRAAKEYQKFGEKIGDVRPSNIVINEDGQIKILSVHTCPGELNNYQKAIESRQENVFLAPEECREEYIKIAQYPGNVSKTQAEIFSIGVTLLESIILKDCSMLYNRSPYKFNYNVYESYKLELKSSFYSEHLKELVIRMLDTNPEGRPPASETYQNLYPFQNDILDLQQFRFPSYHGQTVGQTVTKTQVIQSVPIQQQIGSNFVHQIPQITQTSQIQRSVSPDYRVMAQNNQNQNGYAFEVPQMISQYQHRRY